MKVAALARTPFSPPPYLCPPHISLLVCGSEALGFFPDAVALAVAQLQSAPTPAPADAPTTFPTVEPLPPPALPAAARIAILHVGYSKACRGWACVGAPNVTRVHFSVTVSTPSQLAYAAARLAAVVQVHSSPCLPPFLPYRHRAHTTHTRTRTCVISSQSGALAAAVTATVTFPVTIPPGALTLTAPLPTAQPTSIPTVRGYHHPSRAPTPQVSESMKKGSEYGPS